MNIQQLLARRSDLGTFLVHLTREYPPGTPAKDNLKSILEDRCIEARNSYGSATSRLSELNAETEENLKSQRVVCFTKTPLEHVRLLTEEIEYRKFQFGPYGIAITKRAARLWDVNPVWYLDITPGHNWLTTPLDKLIDTEIKKQTFATSHIAKLTPFIEQMGRGINLDTKIKYLKEYWWEREWRHVGDFNLNTRFIVICPENHYNEIKVLLPPKTPFIDPSWSLEQIIGRLAGFEPEDIDPF